MLDGVEDASIIEKEVFNVLEGLGSILVEPFQTMFDLVTPSFPGEEVLKEEKSETSGIRL